jgi:hypothetical protein
MDGIEGSVESSNSCWSVNISAIAYVVWKLGHAQLMMLGDKLHTKNYENTTFFCEVYSTQHYVIKFVIYLQQVGGFLQVLHP